MAETKTGEGKKKRWVAGAVIQPENEPLFLFKKKKGNHFPAVLFVWVAISINEGGSKSSVILFFSWFRFVSLCRERQHVLYYEPFGRELDAFEKKRKSILICCC